MRGIDLRLGDCRRVMAGMDDNSIDAVVCDPPYELGFMGHKWDSSGIAYDTAVWAQCYRVLKPGGYLLAFGGSRTYHRLACAIEDAGFVLHPLLGWLQGQGFPKATNLSKMIDKAAGAERLACAERRAPDGKSLSQRRPNGFVGEHEGWDRPWKHDPDKVKAQLTETLPATPDAARWEGWFYGRQSLKPCLEPICMAQKPPDRRMVENVLAWGTGAINVDGCRVEVAQTITRRNGNSGGISAYGRNERVFERLNPPGRFPPNVLLSHTPECTPLGITRMKPLSHSHFPRSCTRGGIFNSTSKVAEQANNGYANADGLETVEVWDCADGCAVKVLDDQSGFLHGPGIVHPARRGDKGLIRICASGDYHTFDYGDSGPASRFYPVFTYGEMDAPWLYCPKASTSEREMGLRESFPLQECDTYDPPGTGGQAHRDIKRRNIHPTCKPVALMRWLVRLVTPPEGRVLDPFMGSGTTGIAAALEGFSFTGVEFDQEYFAIAQARIERWAVQTAPLFESQGAEAAATRS